MENITWVCDIYSYLYKTVHIEVILMSIYYIIYINVLGVIQNGVLWKVPKPSEMMALFYINCFTVDLLKQICRRQIFLTDDSRVFCILHICSDISFVFL